MDISNFIPQIATYLGVQPSTLVFFILVVNQGAKIISRLIPNDATGALSVLAKLCAILGTDVSSRITSGVTVQDVAKQSLTTPPIPQKVADDLGKPVSEVLPKEEPK